MRKVEDSNLDALFRTPIRLPTEASFRSWDTFHVRASSHRSSTRHPGADVVRVERLEPPTSASQTRRSAN